MSLSRFLAPAAIAFIMAVRASAETHTLKFVNQCGYGSPVFMFNGQNVLDSNGMYTNNAPISGIGYLQTGQCNTNGESCTLLETTLVNPTCAGCGGSTDISLIPPHEFNVLTSFAYYDGCDGQGKLCASEQCTGLAFFTPTDYVAQVACQVDNVNLLVAFCANASELVLGGGDTGTSPSLSLSYSSSTPLSSPTPSGSNNVLDNLSSTPPSSSPSPSPTPSSLPPSVSGSPNPGCPAPPLSSPPQQSPSGWSSSLPLPSSSPNADPNNAIDNPSSTPTPSPTPSSLPPSLPSGDPNNNASIPPSSPPTLPPTPSVPPSVSGSSVPPPLSSSPGGDPKGDGGSLDLGCDASSLPPVNYSSHPKPSGTTRHRRPHSSGLPPTFSSFPLGSTPSGSIPTGTPTPAVDLSGDTCKNFSDSNSMSVPPQRRRHRRTNHGQH